MIAKIGRHRSCRSSFILQLGIYRLDLVICLIARAKEAHGVLETSFVPNMGFGAASICCKQVLARILERADEVGRRTQTTTREQDM